MDLDTGYAKEATDEQIKEHIIKDWEKKEIQKSKFPCETVTLPSKGLLYPEDNPLHKGVIDMKYLTTREEDILTSPNLIQNGTVIDKLLESLILTDIDLDDIVIGDKNCLIIAARILGYGNKYTGQITCPKCGNSVDIDIDLSNLPEVNLDTNILKQIKPNLFEFTLPNSKHVINFKFLTQRDSKEIQKDLDKQDSKLNKDSINHEMSLRLKYIIQSIDGTTNKDFISTFIDNEMLAMDARALRAYITKNMPDQQFIINNFECPKCGHKQEAYPFTIGANFFWPND